MRSRLNWISRLTIVLIAAFLISLSLLTYYTIESIQTIKELTVKNVLEEKNNLQLKILDRIRGDMEGLILDFSDTISKRGFLKESFLGMSAKYPYFIFPFKYTGKGNYSYPLCICTAENPDNNYQLKTCYIEYEKGEQAEFMERKYSAAKRHYLQYLHKTQSRDEEVVALNALGRISVKRSEYKNALHYYRTVILDYPDRTDNSTYPYSYYGISQVLSISEYLPIDTVYLLAETWLKKLYKHQIPLNRRTASILTDISAWLENRYTVEVDSNISDILDGISLQLQYIAQFGDRISGYYGQDISSPGQIRINGYYPTLHYTEEGNYIAFISNSSDSLIGFIFDVKKYLGSISAAQLQSGYEFDYDIEFTEAAGQDLITSDKHFIFLDPYIPQYVVNVEISNNNMIAQRVNKRRWMAGIALTILLSGMAIIIVFITKDIYRERQMAALKSDFVSNVSHELKSPITSIYMFAQSMLLGRVKDLSKKKHYLELILTESTRLIGMINNVLDFSRKEEGQVQNFKFREGDLSTLLRSIITDMKYWIDLKKISLDTKIEDNTMVVMDSDKVKQVVSNLINNAIKFTPETGSISIKLYHNHKYHLLEIEDSGIGIPADQRDLIFNKFYRVKGTDAEGISGTGLGLTIVKDIVEAHQWEISVESEKGVGSRFTIRIT